MALSAYCLLQTDAWRLCSHFTGNISSHIVRRLADTFFHLLQTPDITVGCEAPKEVAEDLPGEDDDADMTDAEDAPPATEADNTDGDIAGDVKAAVTPAMQGLVQMLTSLLI